MGLKISVVIPALNEEEFIGPLVAHLFSQSGGFLHEVIVADGGSTDHTVFQAQQAGAKIVRCSNPGRAKQMNAGAWAAAGDILHFVHADSWPPPGFDADVVAAVEAGHASGCFRSRFNSASWFLLANSYFTRFPGLLFRGGGQTLFVEKALFWKVKGYDESLAVMEEYDLIKKLARQQRFHILQKSVVVSARKYDQVGKVRLQLAYGLVMLFYFMGAPQDKLKAIYKKMIT